jgi:hypothetical protein
MDGTAIYIAFKRNKTEYGIKVGGVAWLLQTGQKNLADKLEQKNWREKYQLVTNHTIFHMVYLNLNKIRQAALNFNAFKVNNIVSYV